MSPSFVRRPPLCALLSAILALALSPARDAATPSARGQNARPRVERFPAGTCLVARHGGRTYFAARDALREARTGARFPLKVPPNPPEAVSFSPDGRCLILKAGAVSFVLRTADLHPLRRLNNTYAWWEGGQLGFLNYDNGSLCVGGHRSSVLIGRSEITAPDALGRYFLGARRTRPGYGPVRLELWGRVGRGRLRRVRTLAKVSYDPGSEENPHRLAALSQRVLVFGYPNGFADQEDFVGVRCGRRITVPLKDGLGRPLQFVQAPLLTHDAVVGLAESVTPQFRMTGRRYLYRVTASGISLRRVASSVEFVTYDVARGVGLGVAEKGGVTVRYGGIP